MIDMQWRHRSGALSNGSGRRAAEEGLKCGSPGPSREQLSTGRIGLLGRIFTPPSRRQWKRSVLCIIARLLVIPLQKLRADRGTLCLCCGRCEKYCLPQCGQQIPDCFSPSLVELVSHAERLEALSGLPAYQQNLLSLCGSRPGPIDSCGPIRGQS
jgi:hypothetical protein